MRRGASAWRAAWSSSCWTRAGSRCACAHARLLPRRPVARRPPRLHRRAVLLLCSPPTRPTAAWPPAPPLACAVPCPSSRPVVHERRAAGMRSCCAVPPRAPLTAHATPASPPAPVPAPGRRLPRLPPGRRRAARAGHESQPGRHLRAGASGPVPGAAGVGLARRGCREGGWAGQEPQPGHVYAKVCVLACFDRAGRLTSRGHARVDSRGQVRVPSAAPRHPGTCASGFQRPARAPATSSLAPRPWTVPPGCRRDLRAHRLILHAVGAGPVPRLCHRRRL